MKEGDKSEEQIGKNSVCYYENSRNKQGYQLHESNDIK